jgi:hypothetical protein
LFGAKEPSLDSFKQLADLQQKELEKKGQKLPFGVPQAKLPSSVKDDYKKAKIRAKERAKLHEVMKEKMRLHDDLDQQRRGDGRTSSSSYAADNAGYLRSSHQNQQVPARPRSAGNKRFSPLDPLPEGTTMDAPSASCQQAYPPSRPVSDQYQKPTRQANGILKGSARKEAAPWE